MIQRPPGVGAFQFVVLATLRAAQLLRGCRPRVEGIHKPTIIAQFEVAAGLVKQLSAASADPGEIAGRSQAVLEEAVAVVEAV